MARYASFCLIVGPFKGEVPVFARLWPIRPSWHAPRRHFRVRVRVSFTTGAVRSAILATAGLLVILCCSSCVLRSSSSSNFLQVPLTNFIFGYHSFHTAAPTIWNSLPNSLCSSSTFHSFRQHLKTHLFQTAFNTPWQHTPVPPIPFCD